MDDAAYLLPVFIKYGVGKGIGGGAKLAFYCLPIEVNDDHLFGRQLFVRNSAGFDGKDAQVAIGVPHEPGPAAAHFLSAIDAGLLEKAALARPDLSGGPHGFTEAVLAQLQQWARGEYDQAQEPS